MVNIWISVLCWERVTNIAYVKKIFFIWKMYLQMFRLWGVTLLSEKKLFIVCYNEDINDISVTLTVQGQVFFFSSVVLSFPNSLCILDLSWPSSGSEEGLDWRASLEFVLGSFCWRSIRTDWTANGRKRTNFPHLLFFFPDGDLFHYQQIKDNYLFFYFYLFFFSKNFSKHSLTRTAILIGFHRKKKETFVVQLGCMLFI